jgi:hypothetical protein
MLAEGFPVITATRATQGFPSQLVLNGLAWQGFRNDQA